MFRIGWFVACGALMLAGLWLVASFIGPYGWGPGLGGYGWGLGPGFMGLGILFLGMLIVGAVACLAQPDARAWCSSWMWQQRDSSLDGFEKRHSQAEITEDTSEGTKRVSKL